MRPLVSLSSLSFWGADHVLMDCRGEKKRVSDLVKESGGVLSFIQSHPHRTWLVHSEEYWDTLLALFALWEAGETPSLVGFLARGYLDEISGEDGWLLGDEDGEHSSSLRRLSQSPCAKGELAVGGDAKVILYTSGSTGQPQMVVHTLSDIENGASMAWRVWEEQLGNRPFLTSAPPYHIYGLLSVMVRALMGGVVLQSSRISSTNQLAGVGDVTFMTTPSFLKSVLSDPAGKEVDFSQGMIVTSGGVLSKDVASLCEKRFGSWPYEIYGSTETGSIAWRQSKKDEAWLPFPGIGWEMGEGGRLVLHSPLVLGGKAYVHDDIIRPVDDKRFLLVGRSDSVVKIGEKRISLLEVENRILSLPWFRDAVVVLLPGKRPTIGALCVLNEKGRSALASLAPLERLTLLRSSLATWLDPIAIPRKRRFTSAIPLTTMGKQKREEIMAFFDEHYKGVGMHLESQEEGKVVLCLSFSKDSPFFDGHFDEGIKLLPALAQIDIVVHVIRTYLEKDFLPLSIPKTKFSSPIVPESKLRLCVWGGEGSYQFQYEGEKGALYAKGKVSRG